MVHPPPNIIETFSENAAYAKKVIEMWDQVYASQEPYIPKAFLANLRLLFGL